MLLSLISQRLFNVPMAIHPDKAEVIVSALADRLGIMKATNLAAVDIDLVAAFEVPEHDAVIVREGYDVVAGVAMIDVKGTLIKKTSGLRPYSGMTGYNAIRENLFAALNDTEVKAIMLDVDSPGGEVAGCFDLVDTIYACRGDKPIWSILNESAYSAAYAIASAADYMTVPRTGGVGSIGVICMHVDWSKALKADGINVTFITYGDRKADGHPEIPLSDEAHADIKKSVDYSGNIFVETVARNRGVPTKTIKDTQAGCYLSHEGVALGLADAVLPPDEAFQELLKHIS